MNTVFRMSVLMLLSFIMSQTVLAADDTIVSVYRENTTVGPFQILVPTVVEIPLEEGTAVSQNAYVVVENGTDGYLYSLVHQSYRSDATSGEMELFRGLRFLAQPKTVYFVYRNPDRYINVPYGPRGDLVNDVGIYPVPPPVWTKNIAFLQADSDGDVIPDLNDNCPVVVNADQKDIDKNGVGDECDDYDRDQILNVNDNCINIPNQSQRDIDSDGIGDECDDEESRLTERLPWVPWVGIGIALLVLITLFILVANSPKRKDTIS
jgi:hypothetical protein